MLGTHGEWVSAPSRSWPPLYCEPACNAPACLPMQWAALSTNSRQNGNCHRKFGGRKAAAAVVVPLQAHRELQVNTTQRSMAPVLRCAPLLAVLIKAPGSQNSSATGALKAGGIGL